MRYRHKDGSVIWVRCRGIAIRNEEGEAIRMLGAHSDITGLMRAEAELKDKADLLQLLHRLAATANEAVVLDARMNVKLFTPETDNLLNLTTADLGRPLGSLAGKLDDPGLLDDAQLVLDRRATVEKKLLTDDGRCYIRRIVPFIAPDSDIDGVVVAFVDITRHTRDEAAVRESEQRLAYATEATGAAVWDWDLAADTAWWSEEYKRLFGEQPAQTPGSWQWWADRIHPDDRQRVLDSVNKLPDSPATRSSGHASTATGGLTAPMRTCWTKHAWRATRTERPSGLSAPCKTSPSRNRLNKDCGAQSGWRP